MWLLMSIIMVLTTLLIVITISLRNLRRDLGKFTKSIEKLETRLSDQEQQLAEIKTVLSQKRDDPITTAIEAIKNWRTKGLIPALSLLGTQLFRAYLVRKRRKSLPPPDELE